jgi:hypothetical protein
MARVKPYLAIGAIFRNEAVYLREWIEFHRLVGVERFFLYNNLSTDDHGTVLAPYIESGTVVLEDFPEPPPPLLVTACYQRCVETHRDDARWIAFIDLDEFLFSPTGAPLPEILRDYEYAPGVAANRMPFGPSGHRTRPPGLVIESYVRRPKVVQTAIKSIVDPTAVARSEGAHYFTYEEGRCAVDEQHRVLDPERQVPAELARAGKRPRTNAAFTESLSMERLRVNHYATKSRQEFVAKLDSPRPDGGVDRKVADTDFHLRRLDAEADDGSIMQYLPALREALAGNRQEVG